MLIYLIRHGETEFNAEKRYQGSLDIPLSQEGRRKLRCADFSPEIVYTSCLRRTQETAKAIFPSAKLILVEGLQEMSFGDYEGRSQAELADDAEHRVWLESGFTGQCPNQTESHEEFVRRTCEAFSVLVDEALEKKKDCLVIVAHGGTQMAVMSSYANSAREYHQWLTENGGGYVLDSGAWGQKRVLTLLGQVSFTNPDR